MIQVRQWVQENGYTVKLSFDEAETLRNALDQALENRDHTGEAISDSMEIDVVIL